MSSSPKEKLPFNQAVSTPDAVVALTELTGMDDQGVYKAMPKLRGATNIVFRQQPSIGEGRGAEDFDIYGKNSNGANQEHDFCYRANFNKDNSTYNFTEDTNVVEWSDFFRKERNDEK